MSSLTQISLTQSGGNWQVVASLCIGGGVTGATLGADGDTFDIAWGIYGPGGGAINVVSYTPNFVPPLLTATRTGCAMEGYDIGAVPVSPFFTQATLYWAWDPFTYPLCTNGFACVTTTALCGNVLSDCKTFTIVLDAKPDSIRVFGVEGAGNPVAGCYPNPDMLLNFTTLPVVWGDVEAVSSVAGNVVKWETISEYNNDRFEVMRLNDGGTFERIGIVDSKGNGNEKRDYNFLDPNPGKGENQYKIIQYDVDGAYDESPIVNVSFTAPSSLSWLSVGPVPAGDRMDVTFLSETDRSLRLVIADVKGTVVFDKAIEAKMGSNTLNLDMSAIEPGMYFMRLQGSDAKLDYKIMKL